jgi:hypothetical protein
VVTFVAGQLVAAKLISVASASCLVADHRLPRLAVHKASLVARACGVGSSSPSGRAVPTCGLLAAVVVGVEIAREEQPAPAASSRLGRCAFMALTVPASLTVHCTEFLDLCN